MCGKIYQINMATKDRYVEGVCLATSKVIAQKAALKWVKKVDVDAELFSCRETELKKKGRYGIKDCGKYAKRVSAMIFGLQAVFMEYEYVEKQ